jgi:large subunit ribosomal protein L32
MPMGVPKRKRSRQRRDKRFANKGLKIKAITVCRNCQDPLATHQACSGCGFYKGAKVFATKVDRAAKRGTVRQAKAARKAQQAPSSQEQE